MRNLLIGTLLAAGTSPALAQDQPRVRLDHVRSFGADKGTITAAAFAPDGPALAVAGELGLPNAAFRVIDAHTLERVAELESEMTNWKFLNDDYALACVAGSLQVWDAKELTAVETVPLGSPIYGFELSEDRTTLVYGTRDTVHVYRLQFAGGR